MVLNCAGETRKRDVTTMFTYSHANTPLGQSERAYYLSYFIKRLGLSSLIKKHLINEAVKSAVAFFEDGKIRSEIFRCRRVFVTEMLANRGRSVSMFVHALMQVPSCKANITCIAQVTFKLVNKGLLVYKRRFRCATKDQLFSV